MSKSKSAKPKQPPSNDQWPGEPPDELVPNPEVKDEFGVCYQTIRRWERNPKLGYPEPVWINNRKYQWRRQLEAFKARKRAGITRGFSR
jgi:hypothetical protein